MTFPIARIASAAIALAFLVNAVPASAQKSTTTQIQDGEESGTQTVTTTTDGNGNTVTTPTVDVSGPLTNGMPGATYQTDHTTTTTTTDPNGHELDSSQSHVHENLDAKGGKVLSRSTLEWKQHTDWIKGTRTYTSTNVVINNSTGVTTKIDYTTEETYFGAGPTGRWERTGGHQTVTTQKKGEEAKKTERTYDWLHEHWEDVGMTSPLTPSTAQAGSGADGEQVYLTSVAGPSSEMIATVEDPAQVGTVDQVTFQVQDHQGHAHFFQAFTDPDGHIDFRLPALAATVALFTNFTRDGKPDDAAAHCTVDAHAAVSSADPVTDAPQSGTAITRASSAYERGGNGRNLVDMQTRGTDPFNTHVLMDGSEANVQTVAASNLETVGRFSDSVALGRHTFSIKSGTTTSNAFPADVVTLRADPIRESETGSVQTLTVHCDGLPASDSGTMYFEVGGAAELAAGGTTASVPVRNGVAQVRIRGIHAGAARVRFHLHAQIAGFWT